MHRYLKQLLDSKAASEINVCFKSLQVWFSHKRRREKKEIEEMSRMYAQPTSAAQGAPAAAYATAPAEGLHPAPTSRPGWTAPPSSYAAAAAPVQASAAGHPHDAPHPGAAATRGYPPQMTGTSLAKASYYPGQASGGPGPHPGGHGHPGAQGQQAPQLSQRNTLEHLGHALYQSRAGGPSSHLGDTPGGPPRGFPRLTPQGEPSGSSDYEIIESPEEEQEVDDGQAARWAELQELLEAAKQTLAAPFRPDGPPLGFYFDKPPGAVRFQTCP